MFCIEQSMEGVFHKLDLLAMAKLGHSFIWSQKTLV